MGNESMKPNLSPSAHAVLCDYRSCTPIKLVLTVTVPVVPLWYLTYCILMVAVLVCKLHEDGTSKNVVVRKLLVRNVGEEGMTGSEGWRGREPYYHPLFSAGAPTVLRWK